MKPKSFRRIVVLFCLTTWALAQAPRVTQTPRVTKVEPPNWFVGLPSPMLLVYGDNLGGETQRGEDLGETQVKSMTPGVKIDRVDTESAGHYLFVWLDTKNAQPGTVKLTLSNAKGSTAIPFAMAARRKGSGLGALSVDDVIAHVDLANVSAIETGRLGSIGQGPAVGVLHTVTGNLDMLKDAGATAISLTPVYAGMDLDHGAPQDFYALDSHLGTLREFEDMVEAAHERGLKVFLALEMNMVAPEHIWAKLPPQSNWFHGTAEHHLIASGAITSVTDPHASAAQKAELEGWFDARHPDLNQESARASQYLIQNAMWWAETAGVDGFQLDSLPYIGRQFWHEFDGKMHALYPQFTTIGLVVSDDPEVNAFFAGGTPRFDGIDSGVDTLIDFPLGVQVQFLGSGKRPGKQADVDLSKTTRNLESELSKDWMYPNPDLLVASPYPVYPDGSNLLGFAALATLCGIPQFGADFAIAVSTEPMKASMAAIHHVLQMRKDHYALRQGKLYNIAVDDQIYAYARVYGGTTQAFQSIKPENMLIVVNTSDQPQKRTLDLHDTPLAMAQALHEVQPAISAKLGTGSIEIEVAPRSMSIYVVDCGCELP